MCMDKRGKIKTAIALGLFLITLTVLSVYALVDDGADAGVDNNSEAAPDGNVDAGVVLEPIDNNGDVSDNVDGVVGEEGVVDVLSDDGVREEQGVRELFVHQPKATIKPNIVKNSTNYTFIVNVSNLAGDPIREFRIYLRAKHCNNGTIDNTFTGWQCNPKDNWFGPINVSTDSETYCLYAFLDPPSNKIFENESEIFTFNVTTAPTSSCRYIDVETNDAPPNNSQGNWVNMKLNVSVDPDPPVTTKGFIGPWQNINGIEWIDGITLINLSVVDMNNTEPFHAIGVNKTFWRNSLVDDRFCWEPETCPQAEPPDGNGENITINDTLEPNADAFVDEDNKTLNNGTDQHLFVESGSDRRA